MKVARGLRRGLAFLAACALIGAAGGLAGAWQRADHALFGLLQRPKPVLPAAGLRVVDVEHPAPLRLAERPAAFRRALGEVLLAIAARERPPQTVALDVWFSPNPDGIEPVLAGIAALRARATSVVVAVNAQDRHGGRADDPLAAHHPAVYGAAIDGYGHTTLEHAYGVLKYERSLPVTLRARGEVAGTGALDALAVIAAVAPGLRDALPATLVVPLGDDAALAARTASVPLARDGTLGDGWRTALDARLDGASHVLIGSLDADRDNVLGRPGPYLLAWAMSDLLAGRASAARSPLDRPAAVLMAAALVSGVAGGATFGVFHALRRRVVPGRWRVLALGAAPAGALVALGVAAALEALAASAGRVLPLAFALAAALLASGFAWRALRDWIDEAGAHSGQIGAGSEQAIAYDVFVSYAHDPPENARWVAERVAARLASLTHADGRAYRVFFDQRSIDAGRRWKQAIELALLGTRCFVPVVCERYFERPYCREEIEIADQLRIEGRLDMVPIARAAGSVPERYRRKLQYLAAGEPEFDAVLAARVAAIVEGDATATPRGPWQNGPAGPSRLSG